ncbi:MAG: hypothetical protein ABSH32_12820 [Bryobacteraceae bacterium]
MSRRSALRSLGGLAWGSALPRIVQAAGAPVVVQSDGAAIEVDFESEHYDVPQAAMLDWVSRAARAVSAYFGKFPVPRARIRIYAEGRRGVSHGTSYGEDGAWCRISVGRETTVSDLADDWMLTHEMVHFGFPSVPRKHHWIEEGTAVYVEPIARVQVGELTAERVWHDMLRDMPQGLPEAGDDGLDHTHTWGRTYWGGALFCLQADIGIRKNTGNAKGLQDALRAINRAGGSIEVDWPLERALEIGDKATGGKILQQLYEQNRAQGVVVDLADLWKQLGVRREGGGVVFDDGAPLAKVRAAIMRAERA